MKMQNLWFRFIIPVLLTFFMGFSISLMILSGGCTTKYYKYRVYQSGVELETIRCREVIENGGPYSMQGYTDGTLYYENTWEECGK